MTPEGRIKVKIKALLTELGVWYFMPVASMYQARVIDYIACHKGWFIGIEAKRTGKDATAKQNAIMADMRAAGGKTFLIADAWDLHVLKEELLKMEPRDGVPR